MFLDQRIRFHLIEQELPPPPARILEVGCGSGEFLQRLQQRGYLVRGCELSESLVAAAHARGLREEVYQGSGTALPEADNAYDVVLSSDVLEHVPPEGRARFLDEMVRVAAPGARVVLTYWSRNNLPFRIYGAYCLTLTGGLPQWYLEHITLTPPAMSVIVAHLRTLGTLTRVQEYQGPLNMLLCCINHLHHRTWPRLCRWIENRYLGVLKFDRLGNCSSQLISLTKSARE